MANNDQVSQEYLQIKCFLYKYTPPFTAETEVKASLSTFKPYSIPLDDTQYFTKYDISGFVTSYSFEQNIEETTFSWSVELMDQALSYATLNGLKVKPPVGSTMTGGLSFSVAQNITPAASSLTLLSQYETGANTFPNNNPASGTNPTLPILGAKSNRGLTPSLLTVQNTNLTNVLSTVHGLRLSDLIQEYDFISLFLYKNQTPIGNIWGNFIPAPPSIAPKNNPQVIFQYVTTTDVPPVGLQSPTDPYLKYESVLLTKMPGGNTLFSNEFNGFVMKKSMTSAINQVDRITIAGNGWSRLFGATKRAVKPSLFQNSLYQSGQVLGLGDVSAMETVYAGNSIGGIIRDLFDLVYKIDFNIVGISNITDTTPTVDTATVDNSQNGTNLTFTTTTTTTSSVASSSITPTVIPSPSDFEVNVSNGTVSGLPLQATAFTSPITTATQKTTVNYTPTSSLNEVSDSAYAAPRIITVSEMIGNSFYNITSLLVANEYPANLFNLPQYLLSTVMKLRNFAYIEPIIVPATQDFVDEVMYNAALLQANNLTLSSQAAAQHTASSNPELVQISPFTFQKATQAETGDQVVNYGGTQPVFFDPQVQNLTAYFQYLANVFESFSPQLQTPYEILDHIRNTAFVELFEQPNGQFVIRSPQYNNVTASIAGRPDIALIRSSNLNILSSTYNETVENLVTKLFTRYSPQITPIGVLQEFGYCDGKLLNQNGLLETTVEANPNAASASISNTSTNNSKTTGIFGWAEYLMEISNAKLKTGSLTCDLNNTIQVGQTFIDETKFKFGYIVGVSKQVTVAGTATMSLRLSYVRDAVPDINKSTNQFKDIYVDLLPVLTDIEKSFASGS